MFATTMAQRELCNRIDIFDGDGARSAPRRVCSCRTQPDQIGTHAIDPGGKATLGDLR
ncbi:hypothetical protein D3C76_1828410 [compost metagenome]